jgi:hypothetical protein
MSYNANNHPDIHHYIDLHKEVYHTKRGCSIHASKEAFEASYAHLVEYVSCPVYQAEREAEWEAERAEWERVEREDAQFEGEREAREAREKVEAHENELWHQWQDEEARLMRVR